METLKNIGYFPVIGGYKTPFINPMTRVYQNGTTFEDVLALYSFDRELRDTFFRSLCEIEIHIQQLISYYFCNRHGVMQDAYLSSSNFDCSSKSKKTSVNKLINILSFHAIKNKEHKYLIHQRNHHGNVPLWVIMLHGFS